MSLAFSPIGDFDALHPATLTYKSYTISQDATTGDHWAAGYYNAPAADANLDQGTLTQTYSTAQDSRAAHAFLVAGGAGNVNAGSVSITVTGVSVTDEGVATDGDTETIVSDITAMSADEYFETTKKWLGVITYTLVPAGAATFDADFNYGFCKYDDFGNRAFNVSEVEMVLEGGATDSDVNAILYHHNASGWTYHATAFSAGGTVLSQLSTDHTDNAGAPVTHNRVINNANFAWKKVGIDTDVDGAASEGIVLRVVTSAANAIKQCDLHVGVFV